MTDTEPEIGIYRERAHLVAHIAALHPSHIGHTDPDEPDWAVLVVETPEGQMSWHIAPDDLDLFGHVMPTDRICRGWDGHTTPEKYRRLRALTAAPRASQAATGPHSTGDDAGAAHDGDGGSAALSALRDRIRDAFHTINPNCVAYHATDCTDCTTRADAIMSDQPPANELLTAPKSPANDLRQRIAAALNQAFAYVTASGQGTTTGFVAWTDFADAVMAEVQPELDAKDAESAQLRRNISAAHQHLNEIATERDAAIERAEAAQRALTEKAAEVDDKSDVGHATADAWMEESRQMTENRDYWRQRAEAAEERLRDQNGHHT